MLQFIMRYPVNINISMHVLPIGIAGIGESVDCYAGLWSMKSLADPIIQFIIGNWTPKRGVGIKDRLCFPICQRVKGGGRGPWSSMAAGTSHGGGVVTAPGTPTAQAPSCGGHAWAWRANWLVLVCHVPWGRGFRHRKRGIIRYHAGQFVEWRQL